MSATRDSSQKVAFLFTNLYQVYRKEKGAASPVLKTGDLKVGVPVLSEQAETAGRDASAGKSEDLVATSRTLSPAKIQANQIKVTAFEPRDFCATPGARSTKTAAAPTPAHPNARTLVRKPSFLRQAADASDPALERLQKSLLQLQEIQSRLHFMLEELEQIVGKKK